jgi:hypothetical protein
MRTTVNLERDVAAAVERLRRERGLGLSEAVNELARSGMEHRRVDYVYRPQTFDMGMRIDVANIADVLELLDEE